MNVSVRRKIVKKYLKILMMIGLVLSACSAADASLVGSWKLTAYGPESSPSPAVTGSEAGLTFNDDGTVTGTSGCNGLGGEYTVEGDQITFGEFVSTLMACDDPIMVQEGAMHQVLNGTATYKIDSNTLTLINNNMVLVFTTAAYP
jgi:heat shock protein HslJ